MNTPKTRKKHVPRLALIAIALLLVAAGSATRYARSRTSFISTYKVPANLKNSSDVQSVNLKNGETYEMNATFVKNKINGVEQPMVAYNGSIPGPTLRVKQGDTVYINFKNEINMDTTIHAHGLRQDFKMDGMPKTSQDPIKVGDTFKYTWTFPDAGIYWYHPHVRQDYQQASGLFGAIIVEPKDSGYWPKADTSTPLVLNDVLVDSQTGILVPFSKDGADHTLMGRYGNVNLINGSSDWKMTVKQNTVQRLYIVNASNARPYRFAIEGTKLKIIGSDNGRVGVERMVDAITVSPGERYVLDVVFSASGDYTVHNAAPGATAKIGTIHVEENTIASDAVAEYATLRTNTDVADEIASLASKVSVSKNIALDMTLDMGHSSMSMGGSHMMSDGSMMSGGAMTHQMPDGTIMDSNGNIVDPATAGIEWTDNNMGAMSNGVKWLITDTDTGKSNLDINWSFKKGDVVRVRVNNKSTSMHLMQHPIHFHGQRFAVASINGKPNTNIEWKDTATIPSGQTYELLVQMDNPGDWMMHCHIAEHAENGMVMMFSVN